MNLSRITHLKHVKQNEYKLILFILKPLVKSVKKAHFNIFIFSRLYTNIVGSKTLKTTNISV